MSDPVLLALIPAVVTIVVALIALADRYLPRRTPFP